MTHYTEPRCAKTPGKHTRACKRTLGQPPQMAGVCLCTVAVTRRRRRVAQHKGRGSALPQRNGANVPGAT